MKSAVLGLVALLFVPATALAEDPGALAMDQLSIGYGPVRENDGASYRTIRLDDRMFTHFEGNVGAILGGNIPANTGTRFDYRTFWIGGSLLEVEQYLYGSIGIVRLSRQTTHLTSSYQFLIQFGVHYDAWSLGYVHLSNGHTGGKNYGEDMVVVGYGF